MVFLLSPNGNRRICAARSVSFSRGGFRSRARARPRPRCQRPRHALSRRRSAARRRRQRAWSAVRCIRRRFTSEIVSSAPLELTQLLRRQFRRRLDVVGGNAQSPGNRFEGGRRPSPSPRITATARAARCDFVSPLKRRPALAVDRGVSGLTPANCNRYDSTSIIDIAPGLSGRVAFQRRPVPVLQPAPAAGGSAQSAN